MQCDLCGSTKTPFYEATIERVQMTLCSICAKHGKDPRKISKPQPQIHRKTKQPSFPERFQIITPEYGNLIKNARLQRNLKQEDLAKELAEKISVIHTLESGRHEPSIALARKIERHLKIRLVLEHQEGGVKSQASTTSGLTIGDLLKKE